MTFDRVLHKQGIVKGCLKPLSRSDRFLGLSISALELGLAHLDEPLRMNYGGPCGKLSPE